MKRFALIAGILAIPSAAFGDSAVTTPSAYYVGDGEAADFALDVGAGGSSTLYLTHKPSNEPFQGAKVTLQSAEAGQPAISFEGTPDPGVYKAELKETSLPGQIIVQTADDADAIETVVPKYKAAIQAQALTGPVHAIQAASFWEAAAAGALATALMGLVLWGLLGRKSRSAKAVPQILLVLLAFSRSKAALAHGGHDHGGPALETGADTGTDVVMPKKSQLLIDLRTAKVNKESAPGVLKAFGHIVPKPQLDATLTAPQAGFIRGTQGLALGTKVARGQRLGTLQAIGQIVIESPIDGEISEIVAIDGSRVDAGGKLLRVTNMSTLWVDAELFADQLQRLKEATSAAVMVEGIAPIRAKMLNALTPISEETRTAKVFLELIAPPKDVRIGTLAAVSFALAARGETIQIPASALLNRAGDRIVFVQTGPETFSPKQVAVADSAVPGMVLVTQGLNDGDRVVVSGNYQLLMKAK